MQIFPTFPSSTAELRGKRNELIKEIRSSEWAFERTPTTIAAVALQGLRIALSELELELAKRSEDAS